MSKKKKNDKQKKLKWSSPKLEGISELKYEDKKLTKVHAQYGGGGGTVVHNAHDLYAESVYNDCM